MLTPNDLEPWQLQSAKTMAARKQTALFADPGDGKTITTLTALSMLKPNRTLIVAPATVCSEHVWPKEVSKWSHTHKATIETMQGLTPAKRLKVLAGGARMQVINYELLPWLIDALKGMKLKLHEYYSAVVFDELSKLKSPSSARFKKLRRSIVQVPIRFGLTGSPTGNSLMNLWSEMFCVAGEVPLGRTYGAFKDEYFEALDWQGYDWQPKTDAEERIMQRLKPYALYVANARGTESRDRIKLKPLYAGMPADVQAQYNELANEYCAEIEGTTVHSPNAAVLSSKLKQLESGAIYKNIELGGHSGEWVDVHSNRIDSTAELIELLEGQQLLIFYEYDHERQRLLNRFPKASHIKDAGAVDAWNARKSQIMIGHPGSCGHGLNLHLGGAYNLLFFTTPWSLELWEQSIGRLDRVGQQKRVNIYHFAGTMIADNVIARIAQHDERQKRVKMTVAA